MSMNNQHNTPGTAFDPAETLTVSVGLEAVLIVEHNDGCKATGYESGSDAIATGPAYRGDQFKEIARRFNSHAALVEALEGMFALYEAMNAAHPFVDSRPQRAHAALELAKGGAS